MVKLRSICQAVNDIRVSDPGTAMTEGFLRLLIENGDVSYEICGSRVCLNIAIFKCPKCKDGYMIVKMNPKNGNVFYGCTNYFSDGQKCTNMITLSKDPV